MMKRIKKRRYDHVFSLGEACFCATSLLSNGLRTMSDPFDWCVGASFTERVDIIVSGFSSFINQEDLEHIGTREDPEPCHIYKNTRNHIVFNHDFPLDETLEESYASVYQKYQRRINRFLHVLKRSKRVLAVYMELPETEDGEVSDEKIVLAMRKLSEAFPETIFDLLYIRHDKSLADGAVLYNIHGDTVIFAKTYIAKRNAEDNNSVNKKNLSRVLSFVSCNGKYFRIVKKKIIYFPSRGNGYISILGIKVRIKSLIKK